MSNLDPGGSHGMMRQQMLQRDYSEMTEEIGDTSTGEDEDVIVMDGNDPMTQYYLQMTDEVVSDQHQIQQQQKRILQGDPPSLMSPATLDLAMQILSSRTSGELYEGDDELDEDTTLGQSQTGPDDTEAEQGSEIPSVDVSMRATSTSRSADDDDDDDDEDDVLVNDNEELDFVHVHLEHLPSRDDRDVPVHVQMHADALAEQPYPAQHTGTGTDQANTNGGNQTETGQQAGPYPARFSFYRKLAVEGSKSDNAKTDEVIDEVMHAISSGSAGNETSEKTHQSHQSSSVGDSEGALVASVAYQQVSTGYQRQQALQGSLDYNDEKDSQAQTSIVKNYQHQHHHQTPGKTEMGENVSQYEHLHQQIQEFRKSRDNVQHHEHQNDFDFVHMEDVPDHHDPLHSPTNEAQGGLDNQRLNDKKRKLIGPPCMSESKNAQNLTEDNANARPATTKGVHFSASSELNQDYSHTVSATGTATSDGDNDDADDEERGNPKWKQGKEQRQERLLKRREKRFRMTLLQTMQHNTRANFCTIFLLGVAMATLVLLIVAKVTSNKHENMFYDEEKDQNFVVTNNERLMTIEVLAFALIMVLLFGSVCYLGAATFDTNNSLVASVKHEDACLANSSARRKHATYKAPVVVQDGSPDRRHRFLKSSPSDDETFLRSCGMTPDPQTDTEQSYTENSYSLQDQTTFSMMSSESQAEGDDDVLISMEEADQIYRELEDRAVCCAPLSLHASTEDLETHTDDEEGTMSGDDGMKHEKQRAGKVEEESQAKKALGGILS